MQFLSRVVLGLTFAIASTAVAQDPKASSAPPADTAQAKQVILPTLVLDHKGAPVTDLKKEDFSLQVDGKPQPIQIFEQANSIPLTLGLLVDVTPNQRKVLDEDKSGSQAFLDALMTSTAADKAFVVQFAKDIELLQDVTDSKPRLENALKQLGTESPNFHTTDQSTAQTDREGRRIERRSATLYDAIFLSTDEVTSKQTGRRRALVIISDGIDRGSKESLNDALEAAQRADTVIYAIYSKGEAPRQEYQGQPGQRRSGGYPGNYPGGGYPGGGYPGGGYPGGGYPGGGYPGGGDPGGGGQYPGQQPGGGGGHRPYIDGKKTLERIAGETGGRLFELKGKESIDSIFQQIGEDLRSEYRLGFSPAGDAAKDKYHQISLALTPEAAKRKLDIEVRDGYYMPEH